MPATDAVFTIAGLARIQLPGHDIKLCDGGFVVWPAVGTFVAEDPLFGTIESISSVSENVGDEAPAGSLTLLPPDVSAASDLYRSDAQNSPVHFWLADINPATGAIIGTPELQFSGFVDTLTLRLGEDGRKIEIGFVSEAERLFWTKEGNVMSPNFHKAVWPGETGLDHATGVQTSVPWGVAGDARGASFVSGGGGSMLREGRMADRL
jgi:hypothetical protein